MSDVVLSGAGKGRRDRVQRAVTVDGLEPRQLMAVDLSVQPQSSTLPASVLLGTNRAGAVTVLLGNVGDTVADKKTPKVDVEVRLVASGSGESGVVVGRAKNVSLAKLSNTSAAKKLRLSVKVSSKVAAGDYQLVVVADPANKLAEGSGTQSNNNVSAGTVKVAAPFSALEVSQVTTSFPSQTPGSAGTAMLRLKNAGNVPTRGTVDVSFSAVRPQSNDAIQLGDVKNIPVSLAAGKEGLVAKGLRLTVPENASADPVTFTIVATITPKVTPTDTGSMRSGTGGTIALPGVPRSATFPLVNGLGAKLTFSATQVFTGAETGNVTDEFGRTGTYTFVSLNRDDVLLVMTFTASNGKPAFKSRHAFISSTDDFVGALNSKTVTFGVPAEQSQGLVKVKDSSGNSSNSDPGVTYSVG